MQQRPAPHHPAPHRHRGGPVLAFILLAAPVAWLIQTSVNYAVASHACYPASEPRLGLTEQWPWLAVTAITLIGLAVALAAATMGYRAWRLTRAEASGNLGTTLEAGEGRTRFLSLWGTMTSCGFAVALVFSLIAIGGVPPCGYP